MTANLLAGNREETRDCSPAVVYQPIDLLILDPGNPRKHSKKQIGQIARCIKEFGFNVPILVDAGLRIISGHGRVLAARQLRLERVPTIVLEHLTTEQIKAFAVADNRLGELSNWDKPLLGERLRALSTLKLDFSLDLTGFAVPKIELLIEGTPPQPDPADRVPRQMQTGPAVCRAGDLWKLGPHLIYCGSAIDEAPYKLLMGDGCAAMIFTEPLSNLRDSGSVYAIPGSELSKSLTQLCALLSLYSGPGSLHYFCTAPSDAGLLLSAARQSRLEHVDACVWAKDKPGSGSLYQSQHELVFVFEQCRLHEPDPGLRNRRGRPRSNLWRYPEPRSSKGNRQRVRPVRLVSDAILDSTAPADIVLDPFLGQGTTLMAADRVNRVCRGLEMNPSAVDTTIRRWQTHTGNAAYHAVTGHTFDDIRSILGEQQ